MGLVNKLKNILFEEEIVEIPVIEKKTQVQEYKELPKKEEVTPPQPPVSSYNNSNFYNDIEPALKEERKLEERHQEVISERELFRSEKTFNFPAFDEEEFQSVVPKQRTTNVLEYERKKSEKKVEARKPEVKKEEDKNLKTKFRPSPIISPVYGILDKNYTPDEITSRSSSDGERLDVDSVRKKAFGIVEEQSKQEKMEEQIMEDRILEERLEKARTIDELLNDSSDEVIEIPQDNDIDDEVFRDDLEELEEEIPKREEKHEDDTLESDLFDLIDSMYENREEGE